MSLHVPLSDLHPKGHLTTRLHSRNLTALCLGYEFGVVDKQASAFPEFAEKLETAVVLDGSEHANSLLNNTWCNRNVRASVGFDVFVTIGV